MSNTMILNRFNLGLSILILVPVLMLAGCTSQIKYKYTKDLYVRDVPGELTAAINQIVDKREDIEHTGKFEKSNEFFYTEDKLFKKDIPAQITETLRLHFEKAKIFSKITKENIENIDLENKDNLDSINQNGTDILITADLVHFYGYLSGKTSAMTAGVLFGVVGVFTEAVVNKKTMGGKVAYRNINVIDTKEGRILWSGEIDFEFEDKVTFYESAPYYAIEALKKANDKFVRQVDTVVNK